MNQGVLLGATPCVTPNLAKFLARLDRLALEAVAQAAIDRLDELDGDPDMEDDDPAGQSDEDGLNCGDGIFYLHGIAHDGPGCPISDTGVGDRDSEDDSGRCVEFGLDQSRPVSAATAFTSLNGMTRDDVAASLVTLPRRRLDGKLSLRMGGRS